jgi:PAS domain S-box-containing protein
MSLAGSGISWKEASMHSVDYEELVRSMGEAVVVTDATGAIVLWNAAATRIFGFTEAEALGNSLDLIIPERQRSRHWDGYMKTISSGQTRYGTSLLRVPALHKDGRTLSIAFTVTLLKGPRGEVKGVGAVIRDETVRFQEERVLRKRVAELEARIALPSNVK